MNQPYHLSNLLRLASLLYGNNKPTQYTWHKLHYTSKAYKIEHYVIALSAEAALVITSDIVAVWCQFNQIL